MCCNSPRHHLAWPHACWNGSSPAQHCGVPKRALSTKPKQRDWDFDYPAAHIGSIGHFKYDQIPIQCENNRSHAWFGCKQRWHRSHFFILLLRTSSKMFESGSGKFSSLRIRLLFRLRLPSIQPKFTHVVTLCNMCAFPEGGTECILT